MTEGFEEEGVFWNGTGEELEAWKRYKQRKAIAFVQRGYSVEWYPDGSGWLTVYLPERHHAGSAEVRGEIKCYGKPSAYGIEGGMISKLWIAQTRTDPLRQALQPRSLERIVFFDFDRGLQIDRLAESPQAMQLYWAIIEELN